MKIGKPKYEQNKRNYFSFKKNQNSFVLRVLPPLGNLAESGKWSVYHRVEFGYNTSDGRLKPFLSPRVVNFDGMVEVESEAYKRREALKAQQAQAKTEGNLEQVDECTKLLMKYNQDAKHHMNVVDLQGNVGLFKIGHRGYQALKAEIERLRSTGVDPIGIDNGRFFVFSRSGTGRDTVYTVTEYKRKQIVDAPDGSKIEADVAFRHAIDDGLLSKLETDAFELDNIYPSVTAEEEYRIVHEGASAVDEILGNRKKTTSSSNTETTAETTATTNTTTTTNINTATATNINTTTTTALDNQTSGFNTESFSAPTENLRSFSENTQSNPAPSDLTEMSDEDFLRKIESGNF